MNDISIRNLIIAEGVDAAEAATEGPPLVPAGEANVP